MSLPLWKKLIVASVVIGSTCGAFAVPALLAQKPEVKPAAPTAEKKAVKRLPAYYGTLVDGVQREKIYSLQEKYETQIAALAEQIKALQKQRDTEYEAVLTPEQKAKLEKLRADAKAKAAERVAANKAAAEAKAAAEKAAEVKPAATTVKPAK